MQFTNDGKEILSQVPLSIPYDKTRPESLSEQIARMVQGHFSNVADQAGEETFEESNDFGEEEEDIGFDAPLSPFQEEVLAAPPPSPFIEPNGKTSESVDLTAGGSLEEATPGTQEDLKKED